MESPDHSSSITPVIYWIISRLNIDKLRNAILHYGIAGNNDCTEDDLGWVRVYHTKEGESPYSVALMTLDLYEGILESFDEETEDPPFNIHPYRLKRSDYPMNKDTSSISISMPKTLSCVKIENAIKFALTQLEKFGICHSNYIRVDILRESSRESDKHLGVAYIHFGPKHHSNSVVMTRVILRDLPFLRLLKGDDISSDFKINCNWAEDRHIPSPETEESGERSGTTGKGPLIRYHYSKKQKKPREKRVIPKGNPATNGYEIKKAVPKSHSKDQLRQPAPIKIGQIPTGIILPHITPVIGNSYSQVASHVPNMIAPQMTNVPNMIAPQMTNVPNMMAPQMTNVLSMMAPQMTNVSGSQSEIIRLPLGLVLCNGQIQIVPLTQ